MTMEGVVVLNRSLFLVICMTSHFSEKGQGPKLSPVERPKALEQKMISLQGLTSL